jgi:hypothetical protein
VLFSNYKGENTVMPLVHFDRQTVLDFFNITPEDAEQAIKQVDYKDPIDVHDDFSGDDVKAIAMTYAHRKYPSAADKDKVSFGSQVSYLVCGMYTGVPHYYKEQKAEKTFEEFKKAFGVDPGDEGPEIKGNINGPDFTRAGIFLLEGMILPADSEASKKKSIELIGSNASLFQPQHLEAVKKVLAEIPDIKTL